MNIRFGNVVKALENFAKDNRREAGEDQFKAMHLILHHVKKDCAKFVFDDFSEESEDFGLDLMREDLFHLPFPTCYFQMPTPLGDVMLFSALLGAEQNFGNLYAFWLVISHNSELRIGQPMFVPETNISSFVKAALDGDRSMQEKFPDLRLFQIVEATTALSTASLCVAILSTKGIDREEIKPRDGVNAKRKRMGLRPLPEYTVIHLAKHRKGPPQGGTHASPRPHFRRGHVRHLDYLEPGRKTIIPPMVVNAEVASLPTYRVKG